MRVLITGATGLIGKELGRQLVESGHQVLALVRNPAAAAKDLPFPAELWSLNDFLGPHPSAPLLNSAKSVDAIIHLAGAPIAEGRWSRDRKRELRDSRVALTAALDSFALKFMPNVKVYVQGSAIGFYGHRSEEELDASSQGGVGFLPELVRDWELAATNLRQNKRVRSVIVRTGVVLSRQGGALKKMLPIFRRGLGARLGLGGEQWMSWIHISDIVGLFKWSLESSAVSGVVEGVAPEPTRNRDFTTILCRGLGVLQGPPVPAMALKLIFGEMASVLLESTKTLPRRTQELGFKFQFPQLEPAMRNLIDPLRDRTYEKLEEQWVPVPVEKIWPYFCDEKNLEELTPSILRFKVLGKSTPEIGAGTLIDYRLRINGLPFGWKTRIEDWVPNRRFVDLQLKGPYTRWHHTHEFLPLAGGTLLRDRVLYRLPLGVLGDLAASWKVLRDVDTIFEYRRKVIHEKFGERGSPWVHS